MRFDRDFIHRIQDSVPVSKVVGKKVRLKRQGREWIGHSPFKQERTPSFTVNDEKRFYHCFSTNQHGSIFDFLMATEGLTFPEAVELLAEEAGIPLPERNSDDREQQDRMGQLRAAMEAACGWFESQLRKSSGTNARAYLAGRGIEGSLAEAFRIGYAPNSRTALSQALGELGVEETVRIECGLMIAGAEILKPYDRFRDRIIFPIRDERGRVIGFGARAMRDDVKPKYLNSPETSLFHKGHNLFNMDQARRQAHQLGLIVVVEGYMDVIALHRSGIETAVATLGTALTEHQLKNLWKVVDEPTVFFDGDGAGQAAAGRVARLGIEHLVPGKSLRFIQVSSGEDPDDISSRLNPTELEKLLRDSRGLFDYLIALHLDPVMDESPERRAQADVAIRQLFQLIPDRTVRTYYLDGLQKELVKRRSGPDSMPDRERSRAVRQKRVPVAPADVRTGAAVLLRALVHHPTLLDRHETTLMSICWPDDRYAALASTILDCQSRGEESLSSYLEAFKNQGLIATWNEIDAKAKVVAFTGPKAVVETVNPGFEQAILLFAEKRSLREEIEHAREALVNDPTQPAFERLRQLREAYNACAGLEAERPEVVSVKPDLAEPGSGVNKALGS